LNSKLLRLSALALVAAVLAAVTLMPARSPSTASGSPVQGADDSRGFEFFTAGFSESDIGLGRSSSQVSGRRAGSVAAPGMLPDGGGAAPAMAAVAILLLAAAPGRVVLCRRPNLRGPPLAG
jgi:hypothetical protein